MSCDSSQVTLALLNVRSILAKLPDIRADKSLRSASILCFCETWFNASQPSPVLIDDQIDIRCDRVTCENKGGVLMCVPSQMNPSNVQRFATSGIEAVSATIQLPNVGSMQIAVMYRSPSASQTTLFSLLTRLLRYVTACTTPCIILGDFNYDLLCHENSAIFRLMSSFSFKQLVQYPTTPQATIIDHVYYRHTSESTIFTQVRDTYYSDHDTVYCSIPL